ncbi:hypothetical protein CRV08_07000 [Halarcobacter ebronensis]|uniref:N-acetyltransferase domain-containing protein n=1 Tax=Halarcobacter ebronensis TaxID=1462615 RepID=A0A4Q0YHK0_9BACT|nr:hypothetical protein [Halarcobacter ebronensis]RXJ68569.1 hypothetical protein CRV08_07000 [Halarcobacter ebronensis]
MFVGYLRNDFEEDIQNILDSDNLFELELLKQTYKAFPQYCFAAYQEGKIVGVISAYEFQKHIFINVINVMKAHEEILTRLLKLLIQNTSSMNIFVLIDNKQKHFVEAFNFKMHSYFYRFIHSGEAVPFNFSNSIAKQVSGENYENVSKKIDKEVFLDNREDYITKDCVFSNSLKLSTETGFLHSYVVNKRYIRISPWLMQRESFLDAEKLLRGVLYYRGLKKIFSFAPKDINEIVELYESYKFKKDGTYALMYLGEMPNLKLENLYAI